ncbi:MAG: hypothetical protein GSR73_03090 [Desulfurococcales archaeon]|nr:hypothetical protein [Desulfurococcales archaeon]
MPLTTFEEEIYLRALTGRLVGKAIADLGVNKLAVVAPKNIICSSIATATEAAFIDNSGGVTYHFLVDNGNEEEIAERLKNFNAQVVLLQFGGETPIEETKASFVKLLQAMAEKQVPGAIVFHVRIFAAGGVKEALKDEKVKEYLQGKDLYVYTVGFDEGKVYVNKATIEDGEIKLQKLTEYHVTLEHADLLNRSLKDRKVTFQ